MYPAPNLSCWVKSRHLQHNLRPREHIVGVNMVLA